jgi:tyrosinase
MIDNMWAQWQKKDPANRTFALDGTITTLNNPPSANATVDTLVYFAFLDKPRRLGDIMDTQSEEYCYRYEYDQNATKPY